MKLMKRILAIVCTFVMIISMATGVNAVETTTAATSEKGSITVKKAKAGETYKVYKILTLESYDKGNKAYSYVRNAAPDKWHDFVDTTEAQEFLQVNNDGYVTFKSNVQDTTSGARKFAFTALKYAKNKNIRATQEAQATADRTDNNTVEFKNLDLGYYLVESSVGTACSITTTDPDVTIEDKHDAPNVGKKIVYGGKISENEKMNTVNIGQDIMYETTIYLKPYAQNLVLHDTMDAKLKYQTVMGAYIEKDDNTHTNLIPGTDFTVNTSTGDNCTFEITFTKAFYQAYSNAIDSKEYTKIVFNYGAIVADDAPVGVAMLNKTYLSYGKNSQTQESQTETWTYGIPVFKYTGDNTPLAGAKFILSKEQLPSKENALKFNVNGDKYRFTNKGGNVELVSSNEGLINIEGIEDGTYYLKEIEAPKGYNLLKTSITVKVTADGKIQVNSRTVNRVEVQNNKGSLLPSTGGMGTTLIYVVGSILVLASGIVLFSKRKEGTN
uniref:SpaH/EbpB family LPXTG-anchored major pilin n=1 Tax=Catenibacterium mitsuokai TaxID=100886 RepID=UPI003D7813EF